LSFPFATVEFLQKHKFQVSKIGVNASLHQWGRKRLYYFVANIFTTMYTKFYQNWLVFVDDYTLI